MYRKTLHKSYGDNSGLDAFYPELWAMESLAILEENMVIGNLVHRDFSPMVSQQGDVVNTRRPGEYTARRKGENDDVTVQDSSATNVAVTLNEHVHTSFLLRDRQLSLSFKSLVEEFLRPAVLSLARHVDKVLLGQAYQFAANTGGALGGLTASNGVEYILKTREVMNTNKAYEDGRVLIHPTPTETKLLMNSAFTEAQKVGDEGTALRKASLGEKLGFLHYMAQNASSVSAGIATGAGAVDNAAGYPAGTTLMTVDGFASEEVKVGNWVTVAGDMTPQQVSARSGATATTITLSPGLKVAVADNAVITVYTAGAVNEAAGYAAGYDGAITVDGFSGTGLKVGQLVTFGTTTTKYTVIAISSVTSITLDRPLEAAIADDALVNPGPVGDYSFGFHRNALTCVMRPLAAPPAGTGARASVISNDNLSMRVCATYNGTKQGLLVTLDFLMGTKVLDTNLGALMLA